MPCIYKFYVPVIAQQTGVKDTVCHTVLDTLSDTHWIRILDGLVWVRNALRYDPNIFLHNPKHLVAIQKILLSLPKSKLIKEFAEFYKISLPESYNNNDTVSDTVSDTLSKPSGKGIRYTETEKEPEPDTEKEPDTDKGKGIKNCSNPPIKDGELTVKSKYGEFCNVFLTKSQYDKLLQNNGELTVKECIEEFSSWMKANGKNKKDHYAALLNWIKENKRRKGDSKFI